MPAQIVHLDLPGATAPDASAPVAPADDRLPFTVGVELEIASQISDPGLSLTRLAEILERAGVPAFDSSRRHGEHNGKWMCKYDGSCGYEVSSPVLKTMADLAQIKTVCEALAANGCKVNNKCGLHVHIGAGRKITTDSPATFRLLRFFQRYEEAFFLLAGPTRQSNTHAKKFAPKMCEDFKTMGLSAWDSFGRYYWVNAVSIRQHGTIEMRIMPGTLDPAFVVGWVSLVLTTFDTVVNADKTVAWGKAKARDNRMLLFTMLQQAGCYGKAIRHIGLAIAAREWAASRFNHLNTFSAAALATPLPTTVNASTT